MAVSIIITSTESQVLSLSYNCSLPIPYRSKKYAVFLIFISCISLRLRLLNWYDLYKFCVCVFLRDNVGLVRMEYVMKWFVHYSMACRCVWYIQVHSLRITFNLFFWMLDGTNTRKLKTRTLNFYFDYRYEKIKKFTSKEERILQNKWLRRVLGWVRANLRHKWLIRVLGWVLKNLRSTDLDLSE